MKILLLGGTGFIGSRVRELLLKSGHDIWLLVRDVTKIEQFQHSGYHVLEGKADENGRWLNSLPEELDTIINLVKPDFPKIRITSADMEKIYSPFMLNVAKNITYIASKRNVKRIFQDARILNYPEFGGQWLTEKTGLNRSPANWGKLFSDSISFLQNFKQTPTTLLLFGGIIYSSEGVFANKTVPYMFGKQYAIIGKGDNWIQLTHVDDAAAAIAHLIEKNFSEPLINIVDDKPISQKEFFGLLSYQQHISKPIPVPQFIGKTLFGDIVSNSLSQSYRAKNDLLKSTGYWLKYPDYQAGFGKIT
jgi:uncharacterized protein